MKNNDRSLRLLRAVSSVKSHQALRAFLALFSLFCVLLSAALYVWLLALYGAFAAKPAELWISLALPAAFFLLFSLFRKKKNAPRPIDTEPYASLFSEEERQKPAFRLLYRKSGESFPSRHVFSASLIAALWLPILPAFSAVLFAAALCLGASRVLLALHFPRDVLAGALIGAFAGGICDLILLLL